MLEATSRSPPSSSFLVPTPSARPGAGQSGGQKASPDPGSSVRHPVLGFLFTVSGRGSQWPAVSVAQ